jgi:hypothetical protein
LTDAEFATPGPLPPPPRRSEHGCLFGCLVAAAIAITAVIGVFSYFGWYFYSGFKENPTLHAVMSVVNGDQVARSVLGDNIQITNLEGSSFSADTRTGKRESYVAHLKGSRGEGTLSVTIETGSGLNHITSMILTGPDGRTYDLTSSQPRAGPGSI